MKSTQIADGGPSQLKQSSRKGKRAWRKNIDIQDVSQGLEQIREQERLTGAPLHQKQDKDLFQIDLTGDEEARKSAPRPKHQLTSTKILSERSAVPAVFSRTSKRKALVTKEDKERLSRIGKRSRKGPFNSVMDPTELGAGSAMLELSEAVKNSGNYNLWAPEKVVEIKHGLEVTQKPKAKPPKHDHPRDIIEAPAVAAPHQGTSYNPAVDAHQSLLLQAHEAEETRTKEAEELEAFKNKMMNAQFNGSFQFGVATGMTVQEAVADESEAEGDGPILKPTPSRKTKQQRQKAAKQKAEKRALLERAHRKRLLASVSEAKTLRKKALQIRLAQEAVSSERKSAMKEKLRNGLGGQRLGKHLVPQGDIDVQLGEELSESLRALKPEGNLYRDRFLSMQQRALIEPRVRVLPTRRINKIKVYENHAWKRFQ